MIVFCCVLMQSQAQQTNTGRRSEGSNTMGIIRILLNRREKRKLGKNTNFAFESTLIHSHTCIWQICRPLLRIWCMFGSVCSPNNGIIEQIAGTAEAARSECSCSVRPAHPEFRSASKNIYTISARNREFNNIKYIWRREG